MTEGERSGNSRTVALAMWDLVIGAGLLLGTAAIFPIREPTALTYVHRMGALRIAFWIAMIAIAVAVLGIVRMAIGRSGPDRVIVTIAGTIAVACMTFQIGLFGTPSTRTLVILAAIASTVLAAAIALWRRRAWGAYLQLLFAAAAFVGFLSIGAVIPFICAALVLVVIVAFIDPLFPLLLGKASENSPRAEILDALRPLSRRAFTAFVVTSVVAAIIFSINTGNLVSGIELSRQKKTISDMGQMRNAIENYATAQNHYPSARNVTELASLLEPSYINRAPRNDAWGTPFDYRRVVLADGGEGYIVRSAGADGAFEQRDPTAYRGGGVPGFERDIVVSTVSEPQWPEGLMAP